MTVFGASAKSNPFMSSSTIHLSKDLWWIILLKPQQLEMKFVSETVFMINNLKHNIKAIFVFAVKQ